MREKYHPDGITEKVMDSTDEIGVVVIGRNEGARLRRCLKSVLSQTENVVYVDSGSSDDSVMYAKSNNVDVLELDMGIPFSAGRARNEGFQLLHANNNKLKYIQFIDGDCELCKGWLTYAATYLEQNDPCALVAGRREEKYPEKSVYNLLCDIEWNTPVGEAKACGGDFMIRKPAFQQVDGFNPSVIAGEEPDMCYRLRKMKWSIFRLDHPMTLHDANMMRFVQWWKRAVRSGYAYAQGYSLHADDHQGYCLKESIKIWVWAFVIPASILLLTILDNYTYFFLFILYILQFAKIALQRNIQLKNAKHSIIYGIFTVISKFPQLVGQIMFIKRKIYGEKHSIIEHK